MATQTRILSDRYNLDRIARDDRQYVENGLIHNTSMTDLDRLIIAYGPCYENYRRHHLTTLSGYGGKIRRQYLRTLNI